MMLHPALVSRCHDGFPPGFTPITHEGELDLDTGIDFGIHVLEAGEKLTERSVKEAAWILLSGASTVTCEALREDVVRRSLFDEGPTVLHLGSGTTVEIEAGAGRVEWAVARATNPAPQATRLFRPSDAVAEARGQGLAQGACTRIVRTVFDRVVRPDSGLVVGEVVNLPGRWSSYPPHAHPQPEIYHYRFTLPQGWGHAELGDEVLRVRSGDTLKILDGRTHAQVSAPGYGMWYLWIVRHLRDAPYTGFQYDAAHTWLLDPAQQGWELQS
jgi:5-deoxy-glucuronate isomerase